MLGFTFLIACATGLLFGLFPAVNAGGTDAAPGPYFDAVTPGYIESMGMKILNGRDFRDSDANNEPNDLKKAKWRVA